MCDENPRNDVPMQAGTQPQGYEPCNEKIQADPENSLRCRLEWKRNRLSRELVQVEEALRLVYADPNVERIHETLKRARV